MIELGSLAMEGADACHAFVVVFLFWCVPFVGWYWSLWVEFRGSQGFSRLEAFLGLQFVVL